LTVEQAHAELGLQRFDELRHLGYLRVVTPAADTLVETLAGHQWVPADPAQPSRVEFVEGARAWRD